jgi:hypothetical protein
MLPCRLPGQGLGLMMHESEVPTDVALVRQLLARQSPQWADIPVRTVRSAGTDNAICGLGDEMAVLLPRIEDAVEQTVTPLGVQTRRHEPVQGRRPQAHPRQGHPGTEPGERNLTLCASVLISIRCNPDSRRFHGRKRAEGERHTQAALALARRRVDVMWALIDGRCFQPALPVTSAA